MQIVVFYEENNTRLFRSNMRSSFLEAYITIIEERIAESWYEGKDLVKAESLIGDYNNYLDGDNSNDSLAVLEKRVEEFLDKRSSYEYEDWDIVDTEN